MTQKSWGGAVKGGGAGEAGEERRGEARREGPPASEGMLRGVGGPGPHRPRPHAGRLLRGLLLAASGSARKRVGWGGV